ncbi:MAG: 50S ribosomal protein L15 [Patescibacteria group bacterium]
MAITLNNLENRKIIKKRVGRGNGSGHGTYSGRGQKGQKARSGGRGGLKLKGFRRTLLSIPKFKGMKNRFPKAQVVLLSSLEKHFENDEKVSPTVLFEKKLINVKTLPIKILTRNSESKLTKRLEISGCLVSVSAKKVIESVGGKIS